MARWTVGDVTVTSVAEPEHELLVPQDDAAAAFVLAHDWLAPYRTGEGVLRVVTSALLVETPSTRVVVDPWGALDDEDRASATSMARMERRFGALAAAGVRAEDVDVVVCTHIDGVGALTRPRAGAGETTGFPNARYLIPQGELDAFDAGMRTNATALGAIRDALTGITPPYRIDDDVSIVAAPGHSPAHCTVEVASAGETALLIGHMFLHPASVLNPEAGLFDEDPAANLKTRIATLERAARDHALLLGPLFAPPGGGYVEAAGDTWRLVGTGEH